MSATCVRCVRPVEFDSDDWQEPVICAGCLTALEDIDETHAFVAVAKSGAARSRKRHVARDIERAIGTAFENLVTRLTFRQPPTPDEEG